MKLYKKFGATKEAWIIALTLLAYLSSFWGCARMEGERNPNLPPSIDFVNTPSDASIGSYSSTWVYNMPFTLFTVFDRSAPLDSVFSLYDTSAALANFPGVITPDSVYQVTMDPFTPVIITRGDTITYAEGTDYEIDYTTSKIHVFPGGDMKDTVWIYIPDSVALENPTTYDTLFGGSYYDIDSLEYFADFKLNTPNFYAFSYAPVVHWFGNDPDGFVDGYAFADITDPSAIANPLGYINMISPSEWDTTMATSAMIFLTVDPLLVDTLNLNDTTAIEITEHVVYIKCWDNEGASSAVKYRTFFRSNNPPNIPEIKWDEQTDIEYDTINFIRTDTVTVTDFDNVNYDSLFILDELTPDWQGLVLRWRGDDPDDKELYTIPLTYKYFLEKITTAYAPGDTIWYHIEAFGDTAWYSDTTLTDNQFITLVDLETGYYRFSVWSYDDGYESSDTCAMMFFRVVKPTFEHSIILYDGTKNTAGIGELPNNVVIDSFYVDMLRRLQPYLWATGHGYNFGDIFDDSTGTQDVLYWNNSLTLLTAFTPIITLSKYKLVIYYAEDHKMAPLSGAYPARRNEVFLRYLHAGGRVWFIGRSLFAGKFNLQGGIHPVNNSLLNEMQVDQAYATRWPQNISQPFEFVGASNAVDYLDSLSYNFAKTDSLNFMGLLPAINTGLPEIDWMGRNEDATTLYYFNSLTGTFAAVDSQVTSDTLILNWNSVPQYQAPNGYQCWLLVPAMDVTSISSVQNLNRPNGMCEVVAVTTGPYGNITMPIVLVSYPFIKDTITNELAEVLDSNDETTAGQGIPDPTYNNCFIRTSRLDQIFTRIYNETRDSYADTSEVLTDLLEAQVIYDDSLVTITPGHFDYEEPVFQGSSASTCTIILNKKFIETVSLVFNVTQNQSGTILNRADNVVTLATSTQWQSSDSIVVNFTYHQYWEPGDVLRVDYFSDIYWEEGDTIVMNYTYNPTTEAHLKPCAIRYENYDIIYSSFTQLYNRSAVFTFPLYFINNDTLPGRTMGRVDNVVYEMLDWFLDPNVHLGE
jgi:hypothetical protein